MKRNKTKVGKLLCIDEGEYSDYGVTGFFVVIKEFCPDDEVRLFVDEKGGKEMEMPYRFDNHAYLAYLLSKGYLIEIEYDTLHLTDYGNIAEISFFPGIDDELSR